MSKRKYIYDTVLYTFFLLTFSFPLYAQDVQENETTDEQQKEALVPTAYGEQSARSMTSAVSTISSDIIKKNSVSSIEQAMNGTLSGLYSIKSGGDKFGVSNYAFYVRGMATTANNKPLILVDGMESNIDLIDYNEVESITVLKDASALTMYGMRGANGVILINTKHGKAGAFSFKVNIRTGIQQAEKISDRLNAYQYTTLYNEGLMNDGESPMFDPSIYQSASRDPYLYPDENFKDRFLGSTSPFQNYDFAASGGSQIARYFVTAGYMKQEGLFKDARNNNYERYNFRTNLDINLIKGLYFNVLTSVSIGKHKFPYTGADEATNNAVNSVNSIFNSLQTIPANAFPLFNRNGSLGGTSEYQNNPYGMLNKTGSRTDESRLFNAQVKAKYELDMITKGLYVNLAYGFENFNKQYTAQYQKYAVFQEMQDGTYTQFGTNDTKDTRRSDLITGFYRYNLFTAGAGYDRSFGKSDLAAQLVYNQSSETATGDNPDYKYQGLSFRTTYGFMKRYYAEFTGAYQGSNNFKSGKRNGFFPALGLAWILSEENWLKEVDKIDFFKLRTSYGLVGNDQTGGSRFPYRQTYTSGGGYTFGIPGGGTSGTQKGVMANENEKWENAYKANVGVDMELFNSLSLSVDYFKERRTDVLVDYANAVPSVIGLNLSKYNAGKIDNQGIEASLMYNKEIGQWEFFAGGNILWTKNKIVDLKEIAYQYPHQFRKGHSISTTFGYQTNGLYLREEQLNNAPTAQFGIPSLGDLVYVNQNPDDDNIIDSRDQIALGNTFPELIYGVNVGAKFKGFDFYCNLEGSGMYYTNFIPAKFSTYTYDNRWNPANPSVATNYPRLSIAGNYNQQTSDFWQEKTNMLRISALELGYTLPTWISQKALLSYIRIYMNINNLHTFSNMKDNRNPEAVNAGYSEVPLLRTYTFGISIEL